MASASPKWLPSEVATITVTGTAKKKILAGTIKYQMYQTGTKSFISSGNSPYFVCNNKGCDTSKPIALKFNSSNTGDFELYLSLALPSKVSSSNDFRLVLWSEDQDHEPYDFSATIDFSYASTFTDENVGGEPASCKKELKKLCGHCGTSKSCWISCAKQNENALLGAGCKKTTK